MKRLYSKFLTAGLAVAAITNFTACSESFLDEDNRTAYTTQYFETSQGIQDLATALYGNIRWHFGYEWAYGITLYGTDEFTNGADLTAEPWNTYDNRLSSMDCTPATGAANKNCPAVSALWDQMYYGIATANIIITYANRVDDESVRTKCLGEAHFLRGYNYYRLFAQYGAAVLQLQATEGVVKTFTRATEEEMLNQVIADFEEAYKMLPVDRWRGPGCWTKYTAAHFLAKALLYRQSERCSDWNSAYPADTDLNRVVSLADEVIAACPLSADYNSLYAIWTGTDCKNEDQPEILMSCQHSESASGRFGNRTYNYFTPQFSNFSGGWVQRGQYIGGMDFQRCRPTEYAYAVFDNVNDSRMWKTFKTVYGINHAVAAPSYVPAENKPALGDLGIAFILNKKDDPRFQNEDTYGSYGRAGKEHTFVHPESGKWVPNVFPVYLGGKYVMNTYGVSGNTATSNVFCGINKTEDGSRTAEKGDAHRDVIMARSGETYLIKAEAQVRLGKYQEAISTVNQLRKRAEWKNGENREFYTDGSMAFLKEYGGDADNSTADSNAPKKNKDYSGKILTNREAFKYSFIQQSTYYLSTGIERTTEPSNLQIASYTKLPDEDEAILATIGVSGDKDRLINFIMNERTRECLGEWNRWEELSRTKLLVKRAKLFNPEAAANVADKHNLRPIPQTFIDQLQNEDGTNLSDADKAKWQNAGY